MTAIFHNTKHSKKELQVVKFNLNAQRRNLVTNKEAIKEPKTKNKKKLHIMIRVESKEKSLSSPKGRQKWLSTYSAFVEKYVVLCSFLDVDECLQEPDLCSAYAMCSNTRGSYNCFCDAGYTGDGLNCTRLRASNDSFEGGFKII